MRSERQPWDSEAGEGSRASVPRAGGSRSCSFERAALSARKLFAPRPLFAVSGMTVRYPSPLGDYLQWFKLCRLPQVEAVGQVFYLGCLCSFKIKDKHFYPVLEPLELHVHTNHPWKHLLVAGTSK